MNKLRRWLLRPSRPYALPLAADARLRPTDYHDDQVWELSTGVPDSPALTLQTNLGGRVGLATLIPLWVFEGRTIYETQAYATAPAITAFAPGYLRVQASLVPELALLAEYWTIDSHTVGARFSLRNKRDEVLQVHLDIFGHLGAEGKEQPLHIVPLDGDGHGLQLGQAGNLRPMVLLEGGHAELLDDVIQSPKIGCDLTVNGGKTVVVRWIYAGLSSVSDSLAQAQRWLKEDWTDHIQQILHAAQLLPDIETGDQDLDLAIAVSYQQLVTAFLKPTGSLPYPSFVSRRDPGTGFGRDDSSYDRAWSGQNPTVAYLAAQGIASIDPQLAQGIVLNFLAVQQEDGWIDWKPGLGGQRQGLLCMPILARLTWGIFQYTEDDSFLRQTLPGLLKFFERWLSADVDQDGLPEWQDASQTGYPFWPGFGQQAWSDNTAIHCVESPDLLAYLLSEAISLKAIAYYLGDARQQAIKSHIDRLQKALATLWDPQQARYVYRDRDSHRTLARSILLDGAQGDAEHILALPLNPPRRLNLLVEGGVNHTPRFRLHIKGLDVSGQEIDQTTDFSAFRWQHNRGIVTSEQIFSQLDLIQAEGLSRVYRITVSTPDLTHLDINALLPLWSVAAPATAVGEMVKLMTDPTHFWRESGVSMCSAQDELFDPSNAAGPGGVWPFWLTLMGEGLIEAGRSDLAAELLQRLLTVQKSSLRDQSQFHEFYHSDKPIGLGSPSHLSGIVPLHLLMRVLGIRIISSGKVWTGGPFIWPDSVTVRQHGVTVTRSADETRVRFPSGFEAQLAAGAEWQAITDPEPTHPVPAKPIPPHSVD